MPSVTRGHGLLEGFLARQRVRQAQKLIPSSASAGRVLDIGCGSFPLFLVSTDFAEKYGLDRVAVSLPDGLAATNLKVIEYDVQAGRELPFPADHFDAVTMLAVFEHIEPAVLGRLLREVRRVLKPGGVFVMTTPAHWTDGLLKLLARLGLVSPMEIDEHKGSYSHSDIASVIKEAEFAADRVRLGYFELGANIWARAIK
jgi:SAM-dependent methyltransferase